MEDLEDTSPMPWGKHAGEEMQKVPADYLLWLYEENKCDARVRAYIEDNMDVLKVELKRKKSYGNRKI